MQDACLRLNFNCCPKSYFIQFKVQLSQIEYYYRVILSCQLKLMKYAKFKLNDILKGEKMFDHIIQHIPVH